MAEIVNLNRYRKAKERAVSKQLAAGNNARHGRSKADAMRDGQAQNRLVLDFDGKRLDPEENDA